MHHHPREFVKALRNSLRTKLTDGLTLSNNRISLSNTPAVNRLLGRWLGSPRQVLTERGATRLHPGSQQRKLLKPSLHGAGVGHWDPEPLAGGSHPKKHMEHEQWPWQALPYMHASEPKGEARDRLPTLCSFMILTPMERPAIL